LGLNKNYDMYHQESPIKNRKIGYKIPHNQYKHIIGGKPSGFLNIKVGINGHKYMAKE
jgi:hypothetical protein